MSETELYSPFRAVSARGGTVAIAGLFTLTVFVSAFLLFLIQPLFAKMALPLLGGAPGVWNTALVFFQAALLVGYLYAHITSRLLTMRAQMLLHFGLLGAGWLVLPVALGAGWQEPPDEMPIAWLLGLMTVSVGAPFFVLSANAPMLQRWFSASGHPRASDPYFLYAASNLGSFLALLGYPLLIEPMMGLTAQSGGWSVGYVVFVGLAVLCGWTVWRRGETLGPLHVNPTSGTVAPVTWRMRLSWIALAFVPSGLLLSVTGHITTDIVAVPLLWVVPLALYLLSFTFVFATRPLLSPAAFNLALPACLAAAAYLLYLPVLTTPYIAGGLALITLFVVSMVCHGRLAALRPNPVYLTEFYLWMSFGGVLGGAFVGLAAPVLFDGIWEYPILLVMAALARGLGEESVQSSGIRRAALEALPPLALAGLILVLELRLDLPGDGVGLMIGLMVLSGGALLWSVRRPVALALSILSILLLGHVIGESGHKSDLIAQERSFFGVHRVKRDVSSGLVTLVHGNTRHGAQFADPARQTLPLLYYDKRAGLGLLTAALANRNDLAVGAIGLGSGTIACHGQPGQRWTFFEIDPTVLRLARSRFSYLERCIPGAQIILGDARLSLARRRSEPFDLLIVDAFSSDAIPLHLITAEAFTLYLSHLVEGGLMAVHISNRFMNLEPVMARLAETHGLHGRILFFDPPRGDGDEYLPGETPSQWVVMSRDAGWLDALLGPVSGEGGLNVWRPLVARPDIALWTDDYSNILAVLK